MRRPIAVTLAALAAVAATFCLHTASVATTLDQVRKRGFVACGSALRPGLAAVDAQGHWSGLTVEVCRAIAVAALGPDARFAFHRYESDREYDAVRAGGDDVSFLSFGEMAEHKLAATRLPGPTVFIETHDIMVPQQSDYRHARDLAGKIVCSYNGSRSSSSLEGFAEKEKIVVPELGFEEDGEMFDAYNVRRCQAVVGEATQLADERLDGGINHLASHLLPEHLKAFPIVASTSIAADSQWAAIVAWTVNTLVVADIPQTYARVGGVRSMSVDGAGLGLAKDWQATVIGTVGSYAAIFKRTLGTDSPLKLDAGLNAPVEGGGVLVVPMGE